jgi:hypothetical protein
MSECYAEFIDGTWDTSLCNCEDCVQDDHDEIEHRHEAGDITYAEAIAAHDHIDAGGTL